MHLLLLLSACSDYDIQRKSEHPGPDTRPELQDSAGSKESTPTTSDSTPGTVTDDTPPEDVPEGRIDVVLLIDVAYFYDCYHADLAQRSDELINALFDSGADVAVALATYDDYNVSGEWYARDGGLPYSLVQQLTTDRTPLLSAASTLKLEWGGDYQGSGYEAIRQAAGGGGYDQDCDQGYDASTDVRPFQSSASDAFSGHTTGSENTSVTGTGTTPGVGFRSGSTRIVILFSENALRDRDLGHDYPTGTCPSGAGRTEAIGALNHINAKFLGVNAYEFQDIDGTLQDQLENLAQQTGSFIDYDGDGAVDDLAVLYGDWDWPATHKVVDAVWDLVGP